ncbi:50S ribosomal protein L3 [bacterium]|jgi:large subunit ribosomal protein L3|nr:50S ribosomal protein L3 [bacterium]MBT4648868.1 50S ribosomal protein L3 [bacterium]
MAKFILGKKVEMTQKFLENGRVVPVTAVKVGPCAVTQVKGEKDGYTAVQIGFDKRRVINKPLAGHLKDLGNFRYLREFTVADTSNFARGKVFDATSFEAGDNLKVTAVSKGKGFQGVVKRHGFHGSPASHGHKDQLRMPGSIGATDAARVFKGTRMGGHMGVDTVTVTNLELVEVDAENGILYIKGAVPGHRNSLVSIITDGELKFIDPKAKEEKTENTDKKESSAAKAIDDKEVKEVKEEKTEEKKEASEETKKEDK